VIFMDIIRIPEERVGELIGKNGEHKKKIEERYGIELKIDQEGEVTLIGDGADTFFAKDVVKAIGRGFSFEDAEKLFKDDYLFCVIDLRDQFDSDNAQKRMKGRVIGEKGKIKKEIEEATESIICIHGHTISIIAPDDLMEFAKEAIYKILEGAPHTTVLNYLHTVREKKLALRLKG